MRSGTSFFDWTTFKKTICRFWPLWGAYFAMWLIVMPLNGLMMLRMTAYDYNGFGGDYMESFADTTVPNIASNGVLNMSVIFGVLAAMAVFSHLYNARSANLFGSLPIRREGLFLTHYLAGLAFLIVPNVVIFLLTLLVEVAGGYVSMHGLLFWLGVACGEGFFFYSLAVFCAMFTGHILALPAFYGVVNIIAFGLMALVETVLQAFYYGFTGFTSTVYNVVEWLTPVAQLEKSVAFNIRYSQATGVSSFSDGEKVLETYGLDVVGIYALAAVVLTACAFLLYRARRLESAGDVVSVNGMKPVFRYGVALCAGLTLGMGTTFFIGGGEIPLIIAIVVWGVIGYFAAEMLLQKSFRVFGKWKGAAAVAAVFVALFLVVKFDFTGFETRIPDPASVQEVNVWTANAVYLGDDGDRMEMTVSDPEVIRLITILHKEAVAQRDEERQTQAQLGGVSVSLDVRYTLQGGGTFNRRYTLWINPDEMNTEGTAAWAVQQMYDNHALYWEVYGFAAMEKALAEGGRLEQAGRTSYDEKTGAQTDAAFYGKDAQALLAAVKEDFFAGRIGVRRLDDEERWHNRGPDQSVYFSAFGSRDGDRGSWYVSIALQDTASSTRLALEEMADRAVVYDG